MCDALKRLIEAVETDDNDFVRSDDWIVSWQAFRPEPDEMRSNGTASLLLAAKAYHGDLNAAKALHDALLPGADYSVSPSKVYVLNGYKGEADNPARAWLLAILRAYQQVQA